MRWRGGESRRIGIRRGREEEGGRGWGVDQDLPRGSWCRRERVQEGGMEISREFPWGDTPTLCERFPASCAHAPDISFTA